MSGEPLLEIKNVSKKFGETTALNHVSMHVQSGEIIGLVGENGAGKSTLLKIITGVQPPTEGTMTFAGKTYEPSSSMEANRMGIGMVFQEQSLIANLTVGQNIFLGNERPFTRCGLINYRNMNTAAGEVLSRMGLAHIRPETYVRELAFAQRQMVEIDKVVDLARSSDCEHALILLDEPTSVLGDSDVEALFAQMKLLAGQGHAVLFVSHRLDEVLRITDRIYAFKDAANAGEFVTEKTGEQELYQAMVGTSSSGEYYDLSAQREPGEKVVLEVKEAGQFGTFKDVSFQLHEGEILGICGVIGSGKEELCNALCGDTEISSGEYLVHSRPVTYQNPSQARTDGILMIPQERNKEGVFGILGIADNISASNLESFRSHGLLSQKRMVKSAEGWIKTLRIRTSGPKAAMNQLSGGNAQKVVFAKMLSSRCQIILLNHPTRGVDVGAKVEIYQLIRQMAREGKSILLLGDTLDECIGLANRILVMKDGMITKELEAPASGKPENYEIIKYMM